MASNTSTELAKLVYGEEEEDMELGIGSRDGTRFPVRRELVSVYFLLCMLCMIVF